MNKNNDIQIYLYFFFVCFVSICSLCVRKSMLKKIVFTLHYFVLLCMYQFLKSIHTYISRDIPSEVKISIWQILYDIISSDVAHIWTVYIWTVKVAIRKPMGTSPDLSPLVINVECIVKWGRRANGGDEVSTKLRAFIYLLIDVKMATRVRWNTQPPWHQIRNPRYQSVIRRFHQVKTASTSIFSIFHHHQLVSGNNWRRWSDFYLFVYFFVDLGGYYCAA